MSKTRHNPNTQAAANSGRQVSLFRDELSTKKVLKTRFSVPLPSTNQVLKTRFSVPFQSLRKKTYNKKSVPCSGQSINNKTKGVTMSLPNSSIVPAWAKHATIRIVESRGKIFQAVSGSAVSVWLKDCPNPLPVEPPGRL